MNDIIVKWAPWVVLAVVVLVVVIGIGVPMFVDWIAHVRRVRRARAESRRFWDEVERTPAWSDPRAEVRAAMRPLDLHGVKSMTDHEGRTAP